MSGNHTPTPWEIYECPIADAKAAKEELAYQVDHTEPVGTTLYLLNAGGKCPALTGCGPSSKANAEFIVTAVNSYASSQAEIERLRAALEPFDRAASALFTRNYNKRDVVVALPVDKSHPNQLKLTAADFFAVRAALGSKE